MNILFPAMLAGLLSLAIPVVLHLIARQKFPVIDFPTIRLLEGERRTNTLAPRLVDVPQLLLRLLVLLLIILAMSRFFSPWLSKAPATHNTIVVIDASASMTQLVEIPGKGKISLFDLAKQRAATILNNVEAPSRTSVILAGGATTIASPLEPGHQHAAESLAGIKPFDASGSGLVEAVATACDMLRGRREVSSQVIVLTDMRKSALNAAGQHDLQRIADANADLGSTLHILMVDLASKSTENLAITDAHIRGRQVMVGADAHVLTTITNTGTQEQTAKVALSVGERKEPSNKTVKIAPGSRAVVDLTARVNRATRTFARVSIEEDSYARDDHFDAPLPVVDSRRVLLVNGQSAASADAPTPGGAMAALSAGDGKGGTAAESKEPQIDGATILRFVLNPGRELGGTSNSGIDPVMVTAEAVAAQPLSKYEAVILYDVSGLSEQVMRDLTTFVSEGKSLLIIASGKTNAVNFNRSLAVGAGTERAALSPAQLGNDIEPEQPMEISLKDYSHPMLASFSDARRGDLSVIRFQKIRSLQAVPEDVSVILQTTTGQPLAIERKVGRGRIVLFTFGLELDRGNIARTRVFPPFVWRVVDYLTGQLKPLPPDQLVARTAAVLDVSETSFALTSNLELASSVSAAATSQPAGATSQPAGASAPAAPASADLALAASADRTVLIDGLAPGRYQLQKARAPSEKGQIVTYARGVTVQEDPRESDMTRASEADLKSRFGRSAQIVTGELPTSLVPTGGEFWKIFIYALLAAYAAEALIGFMTTAKREKQRAPGDPGSANAEGGAK